MYNFSEVVQIAAGFSLLTGVVMLLVGVVLGSGGRNKPDPLHLEDW